MKKAPGKGERDRLLKKADKVILAAAAKFEGSIFTVLKALDNAISELDADATVKLSNHLRSAAGTFDWPLLSQGANFIYMVMEKSDRKGDDFILIQDIQKKLMDIYSNSYRGENVKGIALIKEMHAAMEKADFLDPLE